MSSATWAWHQCASRFAIGIAAPTATDASSTVWSRAITGQRLLAPAARARRSGACAVAVDGIEASVEGGHVGWVHLAAGIDQHIHLSVRDGRLHRLRCQRQGGRRGRRLAQANA